MSQNHTEFVGSIPEKYDEHLGPLFFEFYGQDLARRVRVPPGGKVLEIACGTGISTKHLRAALPDTVAIVATDLNDSMLDCARRKRSNLPNVRYEQADALDLRFDEDSFDAVVCQFGVMFLPDKAQGLREVARVLKPGGIFTFNTWGSTARNPVVDVAQRTIASFFTADPPSFLTVPFGYYQQDRIAADLAAAGLRDVEFEVVTRTAERPSAQHVATGFVEGNPGIHEIHARASAGPEEIIDAVAAAFREAFGDAPLRTNLEAIVITARQ